MIHDFHAASPKITRVKGTLSRKHRTTQMTMGKKKHKPRLLKFANAATKGLRTLVDKVSAGASSSDEDSEDEYYDETARLIPSVEPSSSSRPSSSKQPFLPTAQSIAAARQQHDAYQNAARPQLPPRSFLPRSSDGVPSALRPAHYGSTTEPIVTRTQGYEDIEDGRVEQISDDVDEVRGAVDAVIGRLMGRGDRLKDIANKSARLENASSLFKKRGRRIESDRWFANHRNSIWLYCTGLLVFLLITTALVSMIVYIFTPKQQTAPPVIIAPPPPAVPAPAPAPAPPPPPPVVPDPNPPVVPPPAPAPT
ncbi:hypothetical protein DFJ77DRAFT_472057 [Powellomyces hirtus]|nr:hypothetical protein DFJ77DRAFT_472057 [Powellomyces hirtus]